MAGADLPGYIIEEILSYLPVKSHIRFKSISKSWYATISDASFAGAHIRRQRNNNHRFLIGPICQHSYYLQLIEFRKDWQFPESLPLEHPPQIPESYNALCHGDGLIVGCDAGFSNSNCDDDDFVYVVWNPSTRIKLKFQCPNSMMKDMSLNNRWLFGLGYDSLMNEYKFVICNRVQYAIFYLRKKCWSEVKNVENFTFRMPIRFLSIYYSYCYGHFSKSSGDFYWFFIHDQSIEVVCFDAREEKLKRLPDPPCPILKVDHKISARFVASKEGNLALFYNVSTKEDNYPFSCHASYDKKILVLKSGDDGKYSWTTLINGMPKLQTAYISMCPLYLAMKDEIVILAALGKYERNHCLLVYNTRDKIFIESYNVSYHPHTASYLYYHPNILIPFRDNLFISSPQDGEDGEDGGHCIQESIL